MTGLVGSPRSPGITTDPYHADPRRGLPAQSGCPPGVILAAVRALAGALGAGGSTAAQWVRRLIQAPQLPGRARVAAACAVVALTLAVPEAAIGPDALTRLRATWREVHQMADGDMKTMTRLARRWCRILGLDPDAAPPAPIKTGISDLLDAIRDAVDAIRETVEADFTPPPPHDPIGTAHGTSACRRI